MQLSGWLTNRSFAPSATHPPPMLVLTRGVAAPPFRGWVGLGVLLTALPL